MPVDELRQRVKIMTAAEPDFVRPFLMRQIEDSGRNENSNSNVQWCSCGVCRSFDDPRMNICCRQPPCTTPKPEFRNLCLRHDALEFANILNWSPRTNQDPSYQLSTFRNQAYRNFVLWQHGRLGAGRRIPVPACVFVLSWEDFFLRQADNTGVTILLILITLNKYWINSFILSCLFSALHLG